MSGQRSILWFTGGAVLGALAVLWLVPSSRDAIRRRLESWLGDEDEAWLEELEQETAATEGGRAGTREWQHAPAPGTPG